MILLPKELKVTYTLTPPSILSSQILCEVLCPNPIQIHITTHGLSTLSFQWHFAYLPSRQICYHAAKGFLFHEHGTDAHASDLSISSSVTMNNALDLLPEMAASPSLMIKVIRSNIMASFPSICRDAFNACVVFHKKVHSANRGE